MPEIVLIYSVIEFRHGSKWFKVLGSSKHKETAERAFDSAKLECLDDPVKFIRLVTWNA